jgi:dTDP-glucose 4,6-dehydratase
MRILVTGGAGFIGSNLIRLLLGRSAGDHVVNLDLLTYAGNLANLRDVESSARYAFLHGDIADEEVVERAFAGGVDAVVNCAAQTHVDRSIGDPGAFARTNVLGTLVLLEASRRHGVQSFVQVSTDEVYGSLGPVGAFTEESPLQPSSPYSASKAGGDLLALSYHATHGLPVTVTRCSNNYGPFQFPEKIIPLFVTNALQDLPLPLYGDGMNVRDWIHVEDHCSALDAVLRRGRPGAVYNVGAECERTNREVTRLILGELGRPESLVRLVTDRPGHDRRYAIDARKLRQELGWAPRRAFEEGLRQTIHWYRDHRDWWESIKSGAYLGYYEAMYGDRLRSSEGA